MEEAVNIAVITCACYESSERIHFLEDSCTRNGIVLHTHGLGHPFPGFAPSFIQHTIPHIERLAQDHSHILFIDGADSIVLSNLSEIAWKYERLGSPACLMSAEMDVPPHKAYRGFTASPPWKYVNGGGYIAEIQKFLPMARTMEQQYPNLGNHQDWFRESWEMLKWELDWNCQIFQTMNGIPSLRTVQDRVVNTVTGTWPCILHFAGGYSDPVTGRDERMKPWVEALQI
jgi:hypothetical protein